jgi:glucokinase
LDESGTHVVGVDLGGTQVRAACVHEAGAVLASSRLPTDRANGPEAILAQIECLVSAVRDERTTAIGIGVPGAFDSGRGVVLGIPALPGFAGFPLAQRVSQSSGLRCVLENDATAAAIGEWRAGAGRGCENFVYVTISTGIGAGVIVDGRVMRGARGLAGEVGHTRVTDAQETCSCGQLGCWEAVASGTALGRKARAAIAEDPGGLMASFAGGGPATAYHVGLAARRGDERALELLDEHARWIGIGLVNVQHAFAPDRIVIGGGLSVLLDLMTERIVEVVRQRRLPGFPVIPIVAPELGDDGGMVGAALQALMAAPGSAADR